MNGSRLALLVATTLLFAGGCAAAPEDGDYSDDPVEGEVSSTQEEVVAACHRHTGIFPQTRDQDRWIIDRALTWVDDQVMYSQVRFHNGWRQDCSGFVSMAWKLTETKPGLVTWTLDQRSHHIDWHDLRPGDAVNKPHHHVFLFAGWATKDRSKMCAIEEYSTGHPASITLRDTSEAKAIGYKPIRRDN